MRAQLKPLTIAALISLGVVIGCVSMTVAARPALPPSGRSVVKHADVALREPGPYGGSGSTIGYEYFESIADSAIQFRKRGLSPGAAIGYHLHDGSEPGLGDEVYYVVRGQGELTLDGKRQVVGAGTAILTRLGSSHGLRQIGHEDLVLVIAWPANSVPNQVK